MTFFIWNLNLLLASRFSNIFEKFSFHQKRDSRHFDRKHFSCKKMKEMSLLDTNTTTLSWIKELENRSLSIPLFLKIHFLSGEVRVCLHKICIFSRMLLLCYLLEKYSFISSRTWILIQSLRANNFVIFIKLGSVLRTHTGVVLRTHTGVVLRTHSFTGNAKQTNFFLIFQKALFNLKWFRIWNHQFQLIVLDILLVLK